MQIDGPIESVLERCRERIDREAPPDERDNMLVVTQVLLRLRYNDPGLFNLFGGDHAMIESPMLDEWAERLSVIHTHRSLIRVLTARFGSVSPEIASAIQSVKERDRIDVLLDWAAICPDLEAFRARLTA